MEREIPTSALWSVGKAEQQTREVTEGLEAVADCPLCRSRRLDLRFVARDTLHGIPGD